MVCPGRGNEGAHLKPLYSDIAYIRTLLTCTGALSQASRDWSKQYVDLATGITTLAIREPVACRSMQRALRIAEKIR